MKQRPSDRRKRGFSLIELLVVIAIIGILGALLLPALSKGRDRAKQTACLNQLRQIGVGFHAFAHDHKDLFPMRVPANQGGSLEWAAATFTAPFAFRHFQTLSNELGAPRVLICPSDTRLPASRFAWMGNDNVSYFVNVGAEFSQPTSVLAGDRNLTNDWLGAQHVYRVADNSVVRWTPELHRFRGNLLFADGSAVASKGLMIVASAQGGVAAGTFALPTAATGNSSPSLPTVPTGPATPPFTTTPAANRTPAYAPEAGPTAARPPTPPTGFPAQWLPGRALGEGEAAWPESGAGHAHSTPATNPPARSSQIVAAPELESPPPIEFDPEFADASFNPARTAPNWLYLLLLLLLLALLAIYFARRREGKAGSARRRAARNESPWYIPGEDANETGHRR